MTALRQHPRLYVGEFELARLKQPPALPLLQAAAARVAAAADCFVKSTSFAYDETAHNAHLMRARMLQGRVVTLLVRWRQTGDRRFRDAAVAHIRAMGRWPYWSWIMWRKRNPDPAAIFDLSYGENSATLAIAYDWLYATLSRSERELFCGIARERSFRPFLAHTRRGRRAWWFALPDCNWNSVCAGGAGMLALAMDAEVREAREVRKRVEVSLVPFMRTTRELNGGWPEGLGYWNYGMRYAFMYLLSHERATGKAHPLLQQPGAAATLAFPLDFCPNGVPCGFGDSNHWRPLPFHYAAAARLNRRDVLAALDAFLAKTAAPPPGKSWPEDAELLLFHPRQHIRQPAVSRNVAKIYRRLDWAVLADRLPAPRLYLSLRGGTTELTHSHQDLLSFHCVVGAEAMLTNANEKEYLDTTFSGRRGELFEIMPCSKNSILINGLGIAKPATVRTRYLRFPGGIHGFRLEATEAMGRSFDASAAAFCARLVLMLRQRAFLIIDRVELPHPGRVESRMHTFAGISVKKSSALLRGMKERLAVTYAADVPAVLCSAVGAPTTPGKGATMLRWCTQNLHRAVTLAALLTPGPGAAGMRMTWQSEALVLEIRVKDWHVRLRLSPRLTAL